jgi:hypothetical protein
MLTRSCGGGFACHSEGAPTPADRHGAPAGLDFDLPVTTSGDIDVDELARLDRHQRVVVRNRLLIWETVQSGTMPPSGVGECVRERGPAYARRVDAHTYEPLPEIATDEGREIFRNWLACRAPIVERTQDRVDGASPTIGWTVREADPPRSCALPTWPSLYAAFVRPRCAISGCHVDGAVAPNLAVRDGTSVYSVAERLIGMRDPESDLCGSFDGSYVEPGDAERSLLFRKIGGGGGPPCGSRMPLAGSFLPQQRIDALERWIECGACTDPSCEDACASDDLVPAGCEVITGDESAPAVEECAP